MTTYCTVSEAKIFAKLMSFKDLGFDTEDDYTDHVNDLVKMCSRRIDRYCKRPDNFFNAPVVGQVLAGVSITEYHNGKPEQPSRYYGLDERLSKWAAWRSTFWLEQTPILTVTGIYENEASIGSTDSWIETTSYRINFDTGELNFSCGATPSEGNKNVRFIYRAGYATTPDEIREACAMLAGHYLQARAQEYTTQHIQWGRPSPLDIRRPEIFTEDIKDLLSSYMKRRAHIA